jgi:hypothetical protein
MIHQADVHILGVTLFTFGLITSDDLGVTTCFKHAGALISWLSCLTINLIINISLGDIFDQHRFTRTNCCKSVDYDSLLSSITVIDLISVYTRDREAFIFLLVSVLSGFNCLTVYCQRQILTSGNSFGFETCHLLLFEFGYCSVITRILIVLFTKVISQIERLL